MKKFKTLIVEDNEIEMKYLVDLLSDHSDIIEIAGKAETYGEALSLLGDNEFDLSILDYQLDKSKTLFNLVETVKRERLGLIVYTSRQDSQNIEKILDVKPDFRLYKPFDEVSVGEFIAKLKIQTEKKEKLEIVTKQEKFAISTKVEQGQTRQQVVNLNRIVCIRAFGKDSKESIFYLDGEREIDSNESCANILNRLHNDNFIQCAKGIIINIDFVKEVIPDKSKGGTLSINHSKLTWVPYSDVYSENLKKKINLRKC